MYIQTGSIGFSIQLLSARTTKLVFIEAAKNIFIKKYFLLPLKRKVCGADGQQLDWKTNKLQKLSKNQIKYKLNPLIYTLKLSQMQTSRKVMQHF